MAARWALESLEEAAPVVEAGGADENDAEDEAEDEVDGKAVGIGVADGLVD